MPFEDFLFARGKRDYARGKARPAVDCILCEIAARRDTVERLEVHRSEGFVVSLNLYPYNPGHLMVFPERHFQDPRERSEDEVLAHARVLRRCLDVLDEEFTPAGFNVGCNVGKAAGGSIPHWHEHVVPRYPGEVGFLDLVGGARLLVEGPQESLERLRAAFARRDQEPG